MWESQVPIRPVRHMFGPGIWQVVSPCAPWCAVPEHVSHSGAALPLWSLGSLGSNKICIIWYFTSSVCIRLVPIRQQETSLELGYIHLCTTSVYIRLVTYKVFGKCWVKEWKTLRKKKSNHMALLKQENALLFHLQKEGFCSQWWRSLIWSLGETHLGSPLREKASSTIFPELGLDIKNWTHQEAMEGILFFSQERGTIFYFSKK